MFLFFPYYKPYTLGQVFFEMFEEMLGHGICNVDGLLWTQRRKSASHMFKVRNLRDSMMHVFVEHGHKLCRHLQIQAETSDPIDLQAMFFRLSPLPCTQTIHTNGKAPLPAAALY